MHRWPARRGRAGRRRGRPPPPGRTTTRPPLRDSTSVIVDASVRRAYRSIGFDQLLLVLRVLRRRVAVALEHAWIGAVIGRCDRRDRECHAPLVSEVEEVGDLLAAFE